MRKIVVPGEVITTERKKTRDHVFIKEGKILSDCVGLLNEKPDSVSVIPLGGRYVAQENDIIIGVVVHEVFSGYLLNINTHASSFLAKRDLDFLLKLGDIVSVKVISVNELREVDVSFPRGLNGGEIIDVSPVKIPRIIGKEGSMLNVLKNGTGCVVVAGRNGRLWVKDGNTVLLRETLALIDRESHTDNLTDKVTKFLEERKPKEKKTSAKEIAPKSESADEVENGMDN